MKIFAYLTLIAVLGFLVFGTISYLNPNAVTTRETALLMLGYGVITLAYAVASIFFMSKSRRWGKHRSRA